MNDFDWTIELFIIITIYLLTIYDNNFHYHNTHQFYKYASFLPEGNGIEELSQ